MELLAEWRLLMVPRTKQLTNPLHDRITWHNGRLKKSKSSQKDGLLQDLKGILLE